MKNKSLLLILTSVMILASTNSTLAIQKIYKSNINNTNYREYNKDYVPTNGYVKFNDNVEDIVDENYRLLIVNGSIIKGSNIITEGSRTFVPLRKLSEALDASINWNPQTKTATVVKGSSIISTTLGSTTFVVNGKNIQADVAPMILNDYIYLPVRFVSENLGLNVSYSNGDFVNSGIVPRIPQVIIDDTSINTKIISKETALKNIKEKYISAYKIIFNKNDYIDFDPSKESVSTASDSDQEARKIISEITYYRESSRYYVFNGLWYILYDKYTGDIYQLYPGKNINIHEIDFSSPTLFTLADAN